LVDQPQKAQGPGKKTILLALLYQLLGSFGQPSGCTTTINQQLTAPQSKPKQAAGDCELYP
jgi:hypothetical protein